METHRVIPKVPPEKLREIAEVVEETRRSNATPLPGPLAAALSPCQDIAAAGYKVRPFYDADFETLQALGHPLAGAAIGESKFGDVLRDFRGPNAWALCYMFTRQIEESDALAAAGLDAFREKARAEFGRKQLRDLVDVQKAVLAQFEAYFSTVVGLEADDGDGKKKQS